MSFHIDIKSHSRMEMSIEKKTLGVKGVFLEVYSVKNFVPITHTTTSDDEKELDQYTDFFGQLAS